MNGLRHPRLPAHLECDSGSRGGGIRSSKNRSGSCSSRVEVLDDANVTDVDHIDIEADGHSNSDDTIAELDEDEDAGIFSIVNDYTSEDEDTFAEEDDL